MNGITAQGSSAAAGRGSEGRNGVGTILAVRREVELRLLGSVHGLRVNVAKYTNDQAVMTAWRCLNSL